MITSIITGCVTLSEVGNVSELNKDNHVENMVHLINDYLSTHSLRSTDDNSMHYNVSHLLGDGEGKSSSEISTDDKLELFSSTGVLLYPADLL